MIGFALAQLTDFICLLYIYSFLEAFITRVLSGNNVFAKCPSLLFQLVIVDEIMEIAVGCDK
jgi:hypothetical protein